jgi:hypothetical protein
MVKKVKRAAERKVVYVNLPFDLAQKLAAEAKAEMRPMSVQAARIVTGYYDAKRKTDRSRRNLH